MALARPRRHLGADTGLQLQVGSPRGIGPTQPEDDLYHHLRRQCLVRSRGWRPAGGRGHRHPRNQLLPAVTWAPGAIPRVDGYRRGAHGGSGMILVNVGKGSWRSEMRCSSALVLLFISPILAFGQIEPKRPLAPEQELRVTRDAGSVTVSGATFSYILNRENGLIGAVRVLGNDITGGTPIPDMVLAEQLDPDYSPYAARREKHAHLTVASENPSRVVITSEGDRKSVV